VMVLTPVISNPVLNHHAFHGSFSPAVVYHTRLRREITTPHDPRSWKNTS